MNNRLNEYLSEVETRLRPLPPVDREQEIAEIAQHLDALIATREAEGQTEEAATADAIAQFGTAHDIGKRLSQTGRHKRFAPLLEVGLFGTAFYAVSGMVWIFCVKVANNFYPLFRNGAGQALFDIRHVPVSWIFGSVALAWVVSRYGWRGAEQKAFNPASSTSAGLRFMLFSFLMGRLLPYGVSLAFAVPHPLSMLNMYGSAMLFYAVLGMGTMWLSAYLAGWSNNGSGKGAGSVASVVGFASLIEAFWWIVACAYQFVPSLWHHATPATWVGLSRYFGLGILLWAVNFLIVRFFVQMGEKARRLPHPAKHSA